MNHSRATIASLIFLLCCLLSSAKLVIHAPKPTQPRSADKVLLRGDQRFAKLKAVLPQHGIVGYAGESGTDGIGDYYLAQYALAPIVVENSLNHPLVVGNFPTSLPSQPPSESLQLVKDFGNGVMLFATRENK